MKIQLQCNCCGNVTELEMTDKEYERYQLGKEKIQDIFPNKHVFYREALINGMCYDCQEKLYHRPKPGNEGAWGKMIAECDCCGRPIYEIDVKDGAKEYVCPECGDTTIIIK